MRSPGYARRVVVIAGVDLAWSGRNPTGLCALEATDASVRLIGLECRVLQADGVAEWLNSLGTEVLAAVDAPLIATPERRAEADLARRWGSRGVFAYAARPAFLESRGIAEGPRLGTLLISHGWSLDPARITSASRVAIEVFPHAVTVGLLGADRVLRYKKGRLSARVLVLDTYRELLAVEAARWGITGCHELEDRIAVGTGRELKHREDRLDAIACALAALHMWRHGLHEGEIFGDAANGYIAAPARR